MDRTHSFALALGLGILALIGGVVMFTLRKPDGVQEVTLPGLPPADQAALLEEKDDGNLAPGGTALPSANQELMEIQGRQRERIAKLEKDLETSRQRIAELELELRSRDQAEGRNLADILQRIDALKKRGMGAILDKVSTTQLAADLKALGEAGFQAALELLHSDDPDARCLGTQLLQALGDPRAIGHLRDLAMEEEHEGVANLAANSLMLMDGPGIVEALREVKEKAVSPGASINSLFGLVRQGDAPAIEEALELIRDQESDIRIPLINGILLLNNPQAIPLVDEIVVQLGSKTDRALLAAIDFYRRVANPTARSRLQGMSGDASLSQEVRDAALAALQQ